jgi:nitrate reductase gamma subunit
MRLLRIRPRRTSLLGDVAIVLFLVAQALDGVLTYLGLMCYGPGIEANPVLASVLPLAGAAATLATAKLVAASLGILLYFVGLHRLVAALTAFYAVAALVPWAAVLLS